MVDRWEVTTHGPFTARIQEHSGASLLLSLGRGDRVTVRPVLRDVPPAPKPPSDHDLLQGRWVATALEMGSKCAVPR